MLFFREISLYLESEPQKKMLYETDNFSYALLFSIIDKEDSGFMDFNNLNAFFESQGIYPYEEEIISILKRLDKDDDGRITLEEFKNGLFPRNLKFTVKITSPLKIKLFSPSMRRSNEKKLLSPTKNFQFEAIRRNNSPTVEKKLFSAEKMNIINNSSIRTNNQLFENSMKKSPIRSNNQILENSMKKNSSKKKLREEIYAKDDGIMSEMKSEIKRDLNISKRLNSPLKNSPARRKTPEKKIFKSFHNEDPRKNATDSKIYYKQFSANKPIQKSPFSKKNAHFDSLKKSVAKEMENSKIIKEIENSKQNRLMSSLGSMNKKSSPKKMEKKQEMIEIVDFFKKIIFLEREVEKIKQDLALRPDFILMDFFSIYDKGEKGYLSQNEIKVFLDSLGINLNNDIFPLFLKRFDKNNFGRFKYLIDFFNIYFFNLRRFCDFVEIFTPSQMDYADLLKQRKPVNFDSRYASPSEVFI